MFLDPVFCQSGPCRERQREKNKKNLAYPLKNQDCCPALVAQKRMVKASRWILRCVYSVSSGQLLPSVQVGALPAYTCERNWWLALSGCLLRSGMSQRSFQRVPQTSASAHCQDLFAPYLIRKNR